MNIITNSGYMVDALIDGQAVMLFKLSGDCIVYPGQSLLGVDAVRYPYAYWADKEANRERY